MENLEKKIEEQGKKIDAVYKSVEKIRRYFKMIFWITIFTVVLPIIGLGFAIPFFMSTYIGGLNGL